MPMVSIEYDTVLTLGEIRDELKKIRETLDINSFPNVRILDRKQELREKFAIAIFPAVYAKSSENDSDEDLVEKSFMLADMMMQCV